MNKQTITLDEGGKANYNQDIQHAEEGSSKGWRLIPESVATFLRNGWRLSPGIAGDFPPESADRPS